jgi:hypothetical protein
MKNIFLSIAVATTICTTAQNPVETNRAINRASEWSQSSERETKKIDSSKLVKKTITQEIALPRAVQFEEPNERTDSQWLESIGINMKLFGSTVRVKSRTNGGVFYVTSAGTTMYRAATPIYFTHAGKMSTGPVTLYIPTESILEIESKNGRLKINNNIKSLVLDNNDSEIEFANIEKLQIRSNRGSFSGGTVAEGDVELSHARFSLKQLTKGLIASNYSNIEIESTKDLKLSSSNDEIDIDNASALYGTKNYGYLRINQLTDKLDIQGINSDVKLRHTNPSAQLVKIVNRNADLRLSTSELSNFSVDIKGSYNKIYSSFAEKTTIDTLTANETESVKTITTTVPSAGPSLSVAETALVNRINNDLAKTTGTAYNLYAGGGKVVNVPVAITGQVTGSKQNPNLKYSAKIGTGNVPKFQIICTTCVIDFK